MNAAAYRMQLMINDLLDYSRISTRTRPFEATSLDEIMHNTLANLELRIRETNGKVISEALPSVEADPVQMLQLLQNLVSNALKFHREGVTPVVKVSGQIIRENGNPEQAVITVEDNGIGFEEKYLDRIFQPFQRLHSRDQFDGSGIGLAICRRIAERHGGSINATSQINCGSRFTVILPTKQTNQE